MAATIFFTLSALASSVVTGCSGPMILRPSPGKPPVSCHAELRRVLSLAVAPEFIFYFIFLIRKFEGSQIFSTYPNSLQKKKKLEKNR